PRSRQQSPGTISTRTSTPKRTRSSFAAGRARELARGDEGMLGESRRRTTPATRAVEAAEAVSWLLDTDVICQPAKKKGDAKVIACLEAEQDRCYTSAIVMAQLAMSRAANDRALMHEATSEDQALRPKRRQHETSRRRSTCRRAPSAGSCQSSESGLRVRGPAFL